MQGQKSSRRDAIGIASKFIVPTMLAFKLSEIKVAASSYGNLDYEQEMQTAAESSEIVKTY